MVSEATVLHDREGMLWSFLSLCLWAVSHVWKQRRGTELGLAMFQQCLQVWLENANVTLVHFAGVTSDRRTDHHSLCAMLIQGAPPWLCL